MLRNSIWLIVGLLIFQINPAVAQKVNKKVSYKILVYGVPPDPIYQNAEQVIAKQWGIEFVAIGGCVVANTAKDSSEKHNEMVYQQLEQAHGKDWKINFYKAIEEEYKKEMKIMEVLDQDKTWQKRLVKEEGASYFLYQFYPILGTENYDVKVSNYEEWKGKNSRVIYYKLKVLMPSKKVSIVSDKKQLDYYYEQ